MTQDAFPVASAIAAHLEGFRAKECEWGQRSLAFLANDATGAEVMVSVDRYNAKGRVVLSGSYPNGIHKVYTPKHFEITCAQTRTGEAMAREITRRLLPDYLPELAEVQKRLKGHQDYVSNAARLAKKLAAIQGEKVYGDDERPEFRVNVDGGYGAARVSPDSVHLELHGLSPVRAEAILRYLAGKAVNG